MVVNVGPKKKDVVKIKVRNLVPIFNTLKSKRSSQSIKDEARSNWQ